MGLDDLIHRLENDAERRIERIRSRAETEARAILRGDETDNLERRRRMLQADREKRHARLERELAAAQQKARASTVRAEQALLDRVFFRAKSRVSELARDPRYIEALQKELHAALLRVQGQPAFARCSPEIASRLAAPAGLEISVDPSLEPGFVLIAGNGAIRIDQTIGQLLLRERSHLAAELLER